MFQVPAVVVIRRVVVALVLSVFVGVTAIAQTIPAWAAQYDVTARIAVALIPSNVAVSPDGTKVYVTNQNSHDVTVIDTTTNTKTATITGLGTRPQGLAVSPDGTKVWVANEDSNNVSVIDTTTNTVTFTITGLGTRPQEVAVSPDGTKVYVTNFTSNNVSVIDTTTNTVTATITVGNYPQGVAVSPDGTKVYVANNGSTYSNDDVSVIDTATNAVIITINAPLGREPWGLAVSPDGTKVYVANNTTNNVSVIDTTTNTVTATIAVGNGAWNLAVSPDGTKVLVTNHLGGSVSVIDTATNSVTATITGLGPGPQGVAFSPDGTKAYVAAPPTSLLVIDLRANVSADAGVPGIFLAVNPILVGKSVTGAPIYCGAASIKPNSTYTLSVQSVTNSALTRTVLASGTVNSQGNLDERVLLGALNPGSYKIVMTGIHASGYQLVLANYLTVGANGSIVSVSAESQQPFLK